MNAPPIDESARGNGQVTTGRKTQDTPENATQTGKGKSPPPPQHLEKRAPAFQFYPADYLADMRIRMLSWASRGLYVDLLCYCWREGWIPADSSAIAQLCHCQDSAIIEPCLALFSPHPDDPEKLIHLRLDAERAKQKAFREERKASGIKGAAKRWKRDGSAIKEPMAKNGSSVFSLQSSDIPPTPKRVKARNAFQKPTIEEIKAFGQTIGLSSSDAEEMFDHYTANGWRVGRVPMSDWRSAAKNWQRRNSKTGPTGNATTYGMP